ncbi:2-amino-4-hydroxy-6-hydroxymethyldihydropteridine diphosphokinase [Lysobacter solisilvae (ex Woo and Kim 2020)]|uniref:2-amino-4-hydroxy-6-hydroxymethyldihydropteridine pyrophosphokinase n=1 Tax=Agrilutibacter terrestris TaxID=2865112 RepID=A0A7H0G0I8_9GAMM|nr:2-amino-4-hydroxy-6-hydroxymethyldihydropteridine diphosphokinase [Lysobacter terrestris]QNP41804.1 2-amino-4-hydroxy-6-hydroxymethyldihydropteridine diphosphokinase [Lysobacter terrestris]
MSKAYLSLGSNREPEQHLRAAIAALREQFGTIVLSEVYRTRAVGFDGGDFLNAAAIVDTALDPFALNAWLHALEDAHGRDRSGPRFGDRTLDIDIVLFDDLVLHGDGHPGSSPGQALQIPRDELKHAFVLRPLAEIAPDVVVPGTARTLAQLWAAHADRATPMESVEL